MEFSVVAKQYTGKYKITSKHSIIIYRLAITDFGSFEERECSLDEQNKKFLFVSYGCVCEFVSL